MDAAPAELDPAANGRMADAFDIGKCLSFGCESLKAASLTLWLGAFLMNCTSGGGGGTSSFNPMSGGDTEDLGEFADPEALKRMLPDFSDPVVLGVVAGIVLLVVILVMVGIAIQSYLEPGWIRAQRQALTEGKAPADVLLSGGSVFFPMFQWKLLAMGIRFGVGMVAVLPGAAIAAVGAQQESLAIGVVGGIVAVVFGGTVSLWLGLGLMFGSHAVALDGVGASEALERSWSLAKGNRLMLLLVVVVYSVVNGLATFVGLMMLCIGALFTGPAGRAITDTAVTAGYLRATRGLETSDAWATTAK